MTSCVACIGTACGSVLLLFCLTANAQKLPAYPIDFTDATGNAVVVTGKPARVVSVVPAITEILFELGAGDAILALTYHDKLPMEAGTKEIVGGFLSPSVTRMESIAPDVIFLASGHHDVRKHFSGRPCQMIQLESNSMEDLYRNVQLLGEIFQREERAAEIIGKIDRELRLVSRKIDKVPLEQRKRVIRLTGGDRLMTFGDDSFQNALIRAAGGIPPQLGKTGGAVEVSLDEWLRFNAQVITVCNTDQNMTERLLAQPGWSDVEAIRSGAVLTFPCDLTCRASVHSGEFVAWLASNIYQEEFSNLKNLVLEEKRTEAKPVDLPLDYVRSARVEKSTIYDFSNKTLVIDFREPMRVISTLEGERTGILSVGNHYSPPPCWGIEHRLGLEGSRSHIYRVIGKSKKNSCFLFTGADMGNLAVRKAEFGDLAVYALVTAGVETNAVRMSRSEGRFIEPGTINVILMANARLTPRALARAIISATEAKTAALQDLDVRCGSAPERWQATGTGTDEVIVAEGRGRRVDNTGGHCKLGELMATAVYEGVKEAVHRQNGITTRRSVFRKLQERHLNAYELLAMCVCSAEQNGPRLHLARLEEILLQPRYAAFMEAAFALSDAYERGLVYDLEAYGTWCHSIAEEIAAKQIQGWRDWITSENVPVVIRMSVNALLNGMVQPPVGRIE